MDRDKQTLLEFYDGHIKQFKPEDPQYCAWDSEESQIIRFSVVSQITSLFARSVLDVGCGTGDYYKYVQMMYGEVDYTGIDINPNMIKTANELHEPGTFETTELFDYDKKHDYVIANGTFNVKLTDNVGYLKESIDKMYSLANAGVAFNALSTYGPIFARGFTLHYYNPLDIFNYCKEKYNHVQLRHDYDKDDHVNSDFTIYIYK